MAYDLKEAEGLSDEELLKLKTERATEVLKVELPELAERIAKKNWIPDCQAPRTRVAILDVDMYV